MNIDAFFSDPFEVLSTRVSNAPARWRGRLNWLKDTIRGGWPEDGPLPVGWLEFADPDSGQMYYVSPEGVSTWDRPPADLSSLGTAAALELARPELLAEEPLAAETALDSPAAVKRQHSSAARSPGARRSVDLQGTSLASKFRQRTGTTDADVAGGSATPSRPDASKSTSTSLSMAERFRQQRDQVGGDA